MRRILLAGIAVAAMAGAAVAHNGVILELPKLTQSPALDGVKGDAEWANAAVLECSPSQILRDGQEFGWRDQTAQASEISGNQLNAGDFDGAGEGRTDADASGFIWHAWDNDALYFVEQVRDNQHDPSGASGGVPTNWWERDSLSLYIDLVHAGDDTAGPPYTAMNIINFVANPQASSAANVTWEITDAGQRSPTQDPDAIEGFEYGYRFAEDEFGGTADFVVEGQYPWATLERFNLPAPPSSGSVMGFSWIMLDPDGEDGYGGQLQCWGWADRPADYTDMVFTNNPAGPGSGTAVQEDSWGRVKATFN